jgi:isocitrate dehydrogenase (NAD+)
LPHLAQRLRNAIGEALNADHVRTGDLGGDASTAAFTKAVVKRIANA